MVALTVFAADSLSAYRTVGERVRRHPLLTVWFILLMFSAAWMGLRAADAVVRSGQGLGGVAVAPHSLLMVAFLILMGKSVVDTNSRCTQNKQMLLILAQPVSVFEALWGKLAFIALSNLAVLAVASGTATVVHALFTPGLEVPFWFVSDLVPLTLLATAMGFSFSIITSQPRLARRLAGMLAMGQLGAALYLSHEVLRDDPGYCVPATLFLLAGALACIPLACRHFLPAWNHETSGTEGLAQRATRAGSGRAFRSLTRWMDPSTRELFRKELVINISRKEVGGTLFTVVGVGAVLVYLHSRLGASPAVPTPFFSLVVPLLVCIGLYMACVLQHAMLGLSSLGKEGSNFWVLKSLPVPSEKVFEAKSGALLAFTPVVVLAVAVPLPVLAGMGGWWVAFFVLAAVALALAYTGVGIWSGTVYPNFDEGTRGAPDIMTMYLIMMACLFLGALVVGLPGAVMRYDKPLGVLSMALSADWCALFLVFSIRRSARNHDRMEVGV